MHTATGSSSQAADGVREALAPTGELRVALYRGSPSSLVVTNDGEPAGVTHDLGRLAAGRLGVPVRVLEHERPAQVFAAIQAGSADFTLTNASEARRRDADFSDPVVRVELGYLVPAGSGIGDAGAIDRPGLRIGVSSGGSSQATLARQLKQANLQAVASLDEAARLLATGELDAFASNKAILHGLADQLRGARILPGRWDVEHLAIAIPKGRPAAALAWVQAFAAELKGSALLRTMIDRAGLRGTAND